MMRKTILLSSIIGILSFFSLTSAQADFSERIQIDEVINRRNIVITHPHTDEPYLLHLESGCGELETGQTVSLVVRGDLNSNYDLIKVNELYRCNIDLAEKFTQKLYVKYVYKGNTEAWVTDESGQEHFMSYSDSCRAMPRYWKHNIYVLQGGRTLAKSDKIFLPNKDGQCWITYLRKVYPYKPKEPEDTGVDNKVPTTVMQVKAFPGNGKVYLSWRPARDNEGISHYIVSYSPYKIRTKDIPVQEMPNQIQTEDAHVAISDLINNETYYFYVLAVDTSGNVSSRWSLEARATPKSSILSDELAPSQLFNLRVAEETARSFLIRWDTVPDANRYAVSFEVDGEREFTRLNYAKRYIRMLKKDYREGKKLTLKVRAYGLHGFIKEEKIDFEF